MKNALERTVTSETRTATYQRQQLGEQHLSTYIHNFDAVSKFYNVARGSGFARLAKAMDL